MNETGKPKLKLFLSETLVSRETLPMHSSLGNHTLPTCIILDAAGSVSLFAVTMPISALAPGKNFSDTESSSVCAL